MGRMMTAQITTVVRAAQDAGPEVRGRLPRCSRRCPGICGSSWTRP